MSVKIRIIGCPQWGAVKPAHPLEKIGKSSRIIFHHTAGHGLNVPGDARADAMAYARAVQRQHMGQGWSDSGHNFLVMRSGVIVQGRWLTISQIQNRGMVLSAHCPGQNDQIGIEHEHYGNEEMTVAQAASSARLMAWIASMYHRKTVLPVDPHRKYYATSCPANLVEDIPTIHDRAQKILSKEG